MSLIVTAKGWQIHVWPEDHPPPHCHVIHTGKNWWVKIDIKSGYVVMETSTPAPNAKALAFAVQLAKKYRKSIGKEWRRLHGN